MFETKPLITPLIKYFIVKQKWIWKAVGAW